MRVNVYAEEMTDRFMAHIVLPDGKTVAHHVTPAIAQAYETGRVPLMLPETTA